MDNENFYRTSDFYLSAFLITKGITIFNLERPEYGKIVFIFKNNEVTKIIIKKYYFSDPEDENVLVDFRKAEVAIKQLKRLLYD